MNCFGQLNTCQPTLRRNIKNAWTNSLPYTNEAKFTINEVHCDNEFHKLMDPYSTKQNPPIMVNYASAQEHVPRAERNNRTIKERVCATYHRLPCDHLPQILVKYLVMESTKKLNFFPNKNGVSKHYTCTVLA